MFIRDRIYDSIHLPELESNKTKIIMECLAHSRLLVKICGPLDGWKLSSRLSGVDMVLPAFGKMRQKSGKVTKPVWAIPRDLFQKKQKD